MSEHDELLDDLDAWGMVQPRAANAIRTLLRERDEARALLMTAYDLVGESIGQRQYDYEARARSFVATCVAALAGGKDERL